MIRWYWKLTKPVLRGQGPIIRSWFSSIQAGDSPDDLWCSGNFPILSLEIGSFVAGCTLYRYVMPNTDSPHFANLCSPSIRRSTNCNKQTISYELKYSTISIGTKDEQPSLSITCKAAWGGNARQLGVKGKISRLSQRCLYFILAVVESEELGKTPMILVNPPLCSGCEDSSNEFAFSAHIKHPFHTGCWTIAS